MTKTEIETIRNIVATLKKPNIGCVAGPNCTDEGAGKKSSGKIDASRIYVDTWIIPALEMLLPEMRNPDLALRMSR